MHSQCVRICNATCKGTSNGRRAVTAARMKVAHFLDQFRSHGGWLDRKRDRITADLRSLEEQLDLIPLLPYEHRSEVLGRILNQAADCFDELEHIERLRSEWVERRDDDMPVHPAWRILHTGIVRRARELRAAA